MEQNQTSTDLTGLSYKETKKKAEVTEAGTGEEKAHESESAGAVPKKEETIDDAFPVKHGAEAVMSAVASIILVFSWLGGLILFFLGIIGLIYADDASGVGRWSSGVLGVRMIILGIVLVVVGYLQWASLKVIVNISHNLYRISAKLDGKQ